MAQTNPTGVWAMVFLFAQLLPGVISAEPGKIRLQLKWHHQFQFAGYYAADSQGYFTEEGLHVEIVEGGADRPPVETVLSGRAEYGVTDSDLVLARMKGKPVVACAAIFQHSPYVLLSRKDRNIRTPHDLLGATIMLSDDQGAAQIRAMLAKEGIPGDQVTLVRHTWNLQELVDKKVDAISAYAMVEPHYLRKLGVEPSVMQTLDYGVDFYGDTLFTTDYESTYHTERVQSLIRATRRGWDYALRHPEKMVDLILTLPGVQARGVTRELLLAEAQGMRKFILPEVVEIGHMNEGRWHQIARTFADLHMAPTPFSLKGFVFLPEPTLPVSIVRKLGILAICIILIGMLAAAWNLQIRQQVNLRTEELRKEVLQRRQAEVRLREQAALLDKAQDAIIVRNLDNEVTYWNRGAELLYGWSRTEASAQDLGDLLHPDPGQVEEAQASTLRDGEWSGELHKTSKDGQKLVVESRWSLVRDDHQKPIAILSLDSDITEKKKITSQLLRTQRMESIGTLAGGIAHDLNNVLTPILLSVEFLRTQVTDKEGLTMLKTLETSAQRGADLVRQVLTFARGMDGERVRVNLALLVADIEHIVQETFPKNITFRSQIGPGLSTILGDATQIHQVLINLCVNSRDAMPQGGTLWLHLESRNIDETYAALHPEGKAGHYAVITVEDTGSGIPAGMQEKIFDPFFTTKEPGRGTGLGLSTSAAIVKSHGGFIRLYSEPNKGSVFKIFLPAEDEAHLTPGLPLDGESPPRGRGETILVIDDESSVREVALKTLERFGYRVLTASNGAEAVSLYAQKAAEIALVLTDMAMPIMDGQATVVALKSFNPGIRIIGSSGMTDKTALARATQSGVQHFIHKPYTASDLLQTVRRALDQEEIPQTVRG